MSGLDSLGPPLQWRCGVSQCGGVCRSLRAQSENVQRCLQMWCVQEIRRTLGIKFFYMNYYMCLILKKYPRCQNGCITYKLNIFRCSIYIMYTPICFLDSVQVCLKWQWIIFWKDNIFWLKFVTETCDKICLLNFFNGNCDILWSSFLMLVKWKLFYVVATETKWS